MAYAQKSLLVAKDLDQPRKAATLENDGDEFVLGVILGRASGISTRTDANTGEINERLTGMFEGRPADPTRDIVQSGACFLPGGFHEMILEKMRPVKNAEGEYETPPPIDFAVEVRTIKASNKAGYSYKLVPLIEATQSDPLSELRETIAHKLPKMLAAPKPAATPAKAPAKAPAKKK